MTNFLNRDIRDYGDDDINEDVSSCEWYGGVLFQR